VGGFFLRHLLYPSTFLSPISSRTIGSLHSGDKPCLALGGAKILTATPSHFSWISFSPHFGPFPWGCVFFFFYVIGPTPPPKPSTSCKPVLRGCFPVSVFWALFLGGFVFFFPFPLVLFPESSRPSPCGFHLSDNITWFGGHLCLAVIFRIA